MSKAFTRESDELPERPALKQPLSALPPGTKNYFTPPGVLKLRLELERLVSEPSSTAIRQRIFEIQESLLSAVAVPPPPPPWEQVLFGATVTVRNQLGEHITYRIVGVDETDTDRDFISWLSPVAKALLKARVGEQVRFRAPAGEQDLEIVKVEYE
jgi:transcription elongation factor GreB